MKDIVQLLDGNLIYTDHHISNNTISIFVCSNRNEVLCTYCKKTSSRIHSTYERSFHDIPIQGKNVEIIIENKKFFCDNPNCHHKTFAETFDCFKPKAKKSNRLIDEIIRISTEVSSVTASKILSNGTVNIGKSTVCNILKKNSKGTG